MAIDFDEFHRFMDVMITSNQGDHFNTLGLRVERVDDRGVGMSMAYAEALIGDPETGIIHGGAITALLDTCSGFVAATTLDDLGMTPTIDLRIDYMRPATVGLTVYADAEVYRVTESVIFTRARAHHGDIDKPIATSVGNFFRLESSTFAELRREFRDSERRRRAREQHNG